MKSFLSICMMVFLSGHLLAQSVTPQTKMLESRNSEFREEILKLADNVYTAVGYDVSNITMIVGTDGVILIDAGMIPQITQTVYAEFRKITDKPIKGVILTHGHGDHTKGLPAFLQDNTPRVWAAANFGVEDDFPQAAGFVNPRSYRQGGFKLSPDERINNGIAPVRYPGGAYKSNMTQQEMSVFAPFTKEIITDMVSQPEETITIAGITLKLIRTDGETSDHLVVWYPDKKIIFPGDQYYKSFPNLYAIRGTAYRDVNNWIKALDTILSYDAEIMAQGHTRPVIGAASVRKALEDYRDAISFVFNKTIEGMNRGLTPDELVEYVQLPDELKNNPDLGQYYGRVEWAVRNIFNGYLGWFDGNPTHLRPLSPKAEAKRMVELAGGMDALEAKVNEALREGDYQWAADLSDHLLALDTHNRRYRLLKAQALRGLADHLETALGRNYYLTVANELEQMVD